MIKPLLRIIPSISGNVRLLCSLSDLALANDSDIRPNSPAKMWEANVRGAKIVPCAQSLYQKSISAGLISSSWEYDLMKFYHAYSDTFYSTCFKYNEADMLLVDKTEEQKLRAIDFEWGCERTKLEKNDDQLIFFAPFYIDDVNDIPNTFVINVKIHTRPYDTVRKLRINIGRNGESKYNYLYRYLQKYAAQLDEQVIFCTPLTNQATYYGIDLVHGGFVTAVDNMVERLYHRQNTINNFDASICDGWSRNKVCMKQIIPLAFKFTIQDFLTEPEQIRFRNLPCEISGAYYKADGTQIPMYDFSTDYMDFSQQILHMNNLNGNLQWGKGMVDNLMDVSFPSLNDKWYIKYNLSNKVNKWYTRWKMTLSDDEHPYITNASWAFSINQRSNYRYGSYPSTFNNILSLANSIVRDNIYNYSLVFPLGYDRPVTGKYLYLHTLEEDGYAPYAHIVDDYKTIIENYCTNWFSTIYEYDNNIYSNDSIWRDVRNNCVYYNGILYDLRNVYDNVPNFERGIDKFAVLLRPVPDLFDESSLGKLIFSNYTLYRQNIQGVTKPNVAATQYIIDNVMKDHDKMALWSDVSFDYGYKNNTDEVQHDEIFTLSYEKGDYVSVSDLSYFTYEDGVVSYHDAKVDYFDITTLYADHDFYTIREMSRRTAHNLISEIECDTDIMEEVINTMVSYYDSIKVAPSNKSYIQLPVYRSVRLTYDDGYVLTEDGYVDGTDYMRPEAYSYCHNSSIINLYNSYIDSNTTGIAVSLLQDSTYIHHISDAKTTMTSGKGLASYAYIIDPETEEEWREGFSYLTVHVPEMNNVIYGTTIYTKKDVIPAAYDVWQWHTFDDSILDDLAYNYAYAGVEFDQSYWAGVCKDIRLQISDKIHSENKYPEYEYTPIETFAQKTFACNTVKYRQEFTGRMYGNVLPIENLDKDKDVLWADPYNLRRVFEAAGYEFDESNLRPMFVKFLNKQNLFYYYVELYKNADRDKVDKWATDHWYEDIYLVEKKLVYDYNKNKMPTIKMVYTPLERWLQFPEFYRDRQYDAQDKYRRFMTFYNELSYDAQEDLFYLKGKWDNSIYIPETDTFGMYCPRIEKHNDNCIGEYARDEYEWTTIKFELCYKKDMYRVDQKLWDATNMEIDLSNYRDIYFYRFQSSVEHDVKYGLTKKIEWEGDLDRLDDELTYVHSYMELHPLKMTEEQIWKVSDENWAALAYEQESYDPYESYIICDKEPGEYYVYYYSSSYFADVFDYAIMTDLDEPINHDFVPRYDDGVVQHEVDSATRPESIINARMIGHGAGVNGLVKDSESLLIPLFNDVFIQPYEEALIYAHYTLHDISKVDVVSGIDAYTGNYIIEDTNFRYDKNAKAMMIKLSDEEKAKYDFTHTYDRYDNCYATLNVLSDDLGFGKEHFNSYIAPDGTTYGFYLIDSHLSNTSNSFDTTGISADGDIIDKLKYFKYINEVNIIKSPHYIAAIYKQLLPFIKQQPLLAMGDAKALLIPQTYHYPLIYTQRISNTANDSSEMDIVMNNRAIKDLELLRYFHGITPLIVKATNEVNLWNIKLKDVNRQMLETGKYLSIGDSTIYSTRGSIYEMSPINIYSTSEDQLKVKNYNNVTEQFFPYEWKHFNASHYRVLENKITYTYPQLMKYAELLQIETTEEAFAQLKRRINTPMKQGLSDEEIKFIMNKYTFNWSSVPVKLDFSQTEKLYRLTLTFTLN